MSDAIGAELAQLAREIWGWQVETFDGLMTVEGAVAKIRDECAEVLECETAVMVSIDTPGTVSPSDVRMARGALMADLMPPRGDEIRRREELADVFFMLVQLGGLLSYDDDALDALCYVCEPPEIVPPPAFSLGRVDAHSLSADWGGLMLAMGSWADACAGFGDLPHMPAAIRDKLTKNKARKWAKPAEDGTISHIKGHDNE